MFLPAVAADAPPRWIEASTEVAQPTLGNGSGATFSQWFVLRSPGADETLLVGCVTTPIPGWAPDMRPAVDARTVALMNASTERVVGVPIEARDATGHFSLRPVGAPEDAAHVGIGRTFVGFGEHAVVTCFATCTTKRGATTGGARGDGKPGWSRACDASVVRAHLEGSQAPPPPGLVVGAVTWAVHHPSTSVAWGGVVVFAVGTLAVALRRRPRSRI